MKEEKIIPIETKENTISYFKVDSHNLKKEEDFRKVHKILGKKLFQLLPDIKENVSEFITGEFTQNLKTMGNHSLELLGYKDNPEKLSFRIEVNPNQKRTAQEVINGIEERIKQLSSADYNISGDKRKKRGKGFYMITKIFKKIGYNTSFEPEGDKYFLFNIKRR